MKCPTCVEQGLRSTVTEGPSLTTAMAYQPFYDEEGRYHVHDMNRQTTEYECSNGHAWSVTGIRPCWCGWPEKKDG